MSCRHHSLEITTEGRGFTRIDAPLQDWLHQIEAGDGLAHVFVHHSSCSLIINENADPDVRADLETLIRDLAPDGDPRYRHNNEGPDDMSAHFRSVLTSTSLSIPVAQGRLMLGTWQGVFLWEHRDLRRLRRRLTFSFLD